MAGLCTWQALHGRHNVYYMVQIRELPVATYILLTTLWRINLICQTWKSGWMIQLSSNEQHSWPIFQRTNQIHSCPMQSPVHIQCKVGSVHSHRKMVKVSVSKVDSIEDESPWALVQPLRAVLKVGSLLSGVQVESIESGQSRDSGLRKYVSMETNHSHTKSQ